MIFTKTSHAIATHISLEAAIVFGVIEYWSIANARKKRASALKNGLYCCYMSWADWRKDIPFISERTIRRSVDRLKEAGVIRVFIGDENSNFANYYVVDQQGWMKFLKWSSGCIMSLEEGRALTPKEDWVDEVTSEEILTEGGGHADHSNEPALVTLTNPLGHCDQPPLATVTIAPYILDKKNNKKDVTKNKVAERVAEAPTPAPKVKVAKTEGSVVWDAYASAYRSRYGFDPIRNAAVNSICKRLHQAVGDEAVVLVQHYVLMNKRFYLEKSHPLSTCLADIQAIKTSYMTGKTMTYQQIKEIEQRQTAKETADEVQQSNGELAAAWAGIDTKRTIKI